MWLTKEWLIAAISKTHPEWDDATKERWANSQLQSQTQMDSFEWTEEWEQRAYQEKEWATENTLERWKGGKGEEQQEECCCKQESSWRREEADWRGKKGYQLPYNALDGWRSQQEAYAAWRREETDIGKAQAEFTIISWSWETVWAA